MIGRIFRTLIGKSNRLAIADKTAADLRVEHENTMRILNMKVNALKTGADRMMIESERTQEVAATLLCKLRKDFRDA